MNNTKFEGACEKSMIFSVTCYGSKVIISPECEKAVIILNPFTDEPFIMDTSYASNQKKIRKEILFLSL
jgi:acetaldehyde dehydrogenase (acetylating)